jgi:hypothetical protein
MVHAENDYVKIGFKYEKSKPSAAVKIRDTINKMLADETPKDKEYAIKLIEQGRQEARQ